MAPHWNGSRIQKFISNNHSNLQLTKTHSGMLTVSSFILDWSHDQTLIVIHFIILLSPFQ